MNTSEKEMSEEEATRNLRGNLPQTKVVLSLTSSQFLEKLLMTSINECLKVTFICALDGKREKEIARLLLLTLDAKLCQLNGQKEREREEEFYHPRAVNTHEPSAKQ
jgi:hypothetical protein